MNCFLNFSCCCVGFIIHYFLVFPVEVMVVFPAMISSFVSSSISSSYSSSVLFGCTFYTNTTSRTLLSHAKDTVPSEQRNNIVYKYDCKNCEAVYFGESKRTLAERTKDDGRSTSDNMVFYKHFLMLLGVVKTFCLFCLSCWYMLRNV